MKPKLNSFISNNNQRSYEDVIDTLVSQDKYKEDTKFTVLTLEQPMELPAGEYKVQVRNFVDKNGIARTSVKLQHKIT